MRFARSPLSRLLESSSVVFGEQDSSHFGCPGMHVGEGINVLRKLKDLG